MKNLLFACALAVAVPAISFAQTISPDADKVLVKTLTPGDAAVIQMDFKHKSMVAEAWGNDDVRITIEIHSNMPDAIIEQLIKAGRYTISSTIVGDTLKVGAIGTTKAVTVKGIDLDEELVIHVNTPSNFIRNGNVLQRDMQMIVSLIESAGGKGRANSELRAQLRKINKTVKLEYKIVSKVTPQQFEDMVKEKELMGMNGSNKSTPPNTSAKMSTTKPTLQEMGLKRGDILIGGEPIGIE